VPRLFRRVRRARSILFGARARRRRRPGLPAGQPEPVVRVQVRRVRPVHRRL